MHKHSAIHVLGLSPMLNKHPLREKEALVSSRGRKLRLRRRSLWRSSSLGSNLINFRYNCFVLLRVAPLLVPVDALAVLD